MNLYLGIDITDKSVQVASIQVASRKATLENLVSVEQADLEASNDGLKQAALLATNGNLSSISGVAVSLDGSLTAVKRIKLPLSIQKQLVEVLPFELEAELPFELTSAVWDYVISSSESTGAKSIFQMQGTEKLGAKKDEQGELLLCVAVARVEHVRALIQRVKESLNIEPERIGCSAFPITNILSLGLLKEAQNEIVMVLELMHYTCNILFTRGPYPLWCRTIPVGTSNLPTSAPKLIRELKITMASFRSFDSIQMTSPSKVFLAGAGAYVPGAEVFLSSELQIPVFTMKLEPSSFLEFSTSINQNLLSSSAAFLKATGLALSLSKKTSDLNLRKGVLAFERGFGWIQEKIPILSGFAAIILLAFMVSSVMQYVHASRENHLLRFALGKVSQDVLGTETTDISEASDLLQKQTFVDDDPMPHADAFDVMAVLAEVIPSSMVHDVEELDVQKNHAVIHGIVSSVNDVEQIGKALGVEKCFRDVKISRTTKEVGGDRTKYQLEFDLKCPDDEKNKMKKKSSDKTADKSLEKIEGELK